MGTVQYLYDANGNPEMRTDGRGIVTCYGNYQNGNCDYKGYDALGRVVRKSHSDGTPAVSYGYGVQRTTCPDMSVDYAAGRLLYMSNGVYTYGYNCYDALGRPRRAIDTNGRPRVHRGDSQTPAGMHVPHIPLWSSRLIRILRSSPGK